MDGKLSSQLSSQSNDKCIAAVEVERRWAMKKQIRWRSFLRRRWTRRPRANGDDCWGSHRHLRTYSQLLRLPCASDKLGRLGTLMRTETLFPPPLNLPIFNTIRLHYSSFFVEAYECWLTGWSASCPRRKYMDVSPQRQMVDLCKTAWYLWKTSCRECCSSNWLSLWCSHFWTKPTHNLPYRTWLTCIWAPHAIQWCTDQAYDRKAPFSRKAHQSIFPLPAQKCASLWSILTSNSSICGRFLWLGRRSAYCNCCTV
jgi:hypothetical protein